uniref:cysteine-rich and transmembrane domain-containing protein WIH2-like n=1 Tax=Erigeron canadensis TaxID=72917 RepID=UPI001CB92FCB|nr:cysteine-rich and transmembrane domain-containing protein WIH2-like [Erigeron canadensis]
MSHSNQNEIPVAYPPQPQGASYVMAPPPVGYPNMDLNAKIDNSNNDQAPVHTQTRGDGFWKGCCAALCCCCMLDACF